MSADVVFKIDVAAFGLPPSESTGGANGLVALDLRLLEYLGGTPLAPPLWSTDPWWTAPALQAHRDAAKAVLAARERDGVAALDDPLLAVTLPFWRAVLRDAGREEGAVHLAGWLPGESSSPLWEAYVAMALLNARGLEVRLVEPSAADPIAPEAHASWTRAQRRILDVLLARGNVDEVQGACEVALSEVERLIEGAARERAVAAKETLGAAREVLARSERALRRVRERQREVEAQLATTRAAVASLEDQAGRLLERWIKLDDLLGPGNKHLEFLQELSEQRGSWSFWLGNLAVRPVARARALVRRLGSLQAGPQAPPPERRPIDP